MLADELVRGEAFEGLEPSGEVVGVDEVSQMRAQLSASYSWALSFPPSSQGSSPTGVSLRSRFGLTSLLVAVRASAGQLNRWGFPRG
jgi:hypothetical protein